MFEIDKTNLYEALGLEKIIELSKAFYRRVDADPDPEFRGMFPSNLEDAVQNQYEFFVQRLGGPQLYSQRKGHPALRQRHAAFPITLEFAQHWLAHMEAAMEEVAIPEPYRPALREFFRHTAEFLVNRPEAP